MSRAFTMQRRVQFAETDLAGVMHFANYFRMMEEVEHEFWRARGLSVVTGTNEDPHVSWPRVACQCEYLAPARFEDVLELALTVQRVGERSVTYAVEFRRGVDLVARGKTTAVCCSVRQGVFQTMAIPPGLRTVLHSLAETEV